MTIISLLATMHKKKICPVCDHVSQGQTRQSNLAWKLVRPAPFQTLEVQ